MTAPAPTHPVPLCPVTGLPATRLVQRVSAHLLAAWWRIIMRVDVRSSFRDATSFGLWESPTGLYFFEPARAGDAGFYEAFYARLPARYYPHEGYPRGEFVLAGGLVRDGERVLDVGCGFGPFRFEMRHGHYTGLDPHFSGEAGAEWARVETLAEHLADNAGAYDVCTAFQVVEHLEDPVGFLAEMVQAVRPGGRIMVGVPHRPAAHTRIPNYVMNAVPHHLTWWTKEALIALAGRAGLVNPRVETVPWTPCEGIIYWIARCTPLRIGDRYFRHALGWYAAMLVGSAAGYLMWTLRPAPKRPDDEGASLLLIAEKPQADGSRVPPVDPGSRSGARSDTAMEH